MPTHKIVLTIATLALAACSAAAVNTRTEQIAAVQDFVATAGLTEVTQVRLQGLLSFDAVNEGFVTVPGHGGTYLVEFARACRDIGETAFRSTVPVDVRARGSSRNLSVLRARSDTIRGCRIARMYEITEARAACAQHAFQRATDRQWRVLAEPAAGPGRTAQMDEPRTPRCVIDYVS